MVIIIFSVYLVHPDPVNNLHFSVIFCQRFPKAILILKINAGQIPDVPAQT